MGTGSGTMAVIGMYCIATFVIRRGGTGSGEMAILRFSCLILKAKWCIVMPCFVYPLPALQGCVCQGEHDKAGNIPRSS